MSDKIKRAITILCMVASVVVILTYLTAPAKVTSVDYIGNDKVSETVTKDENGELVISSSNLEYIPIINKEHIQKGDEITYPVKVYNVNYRKLGFSHVQTIEVMSDEIVKNIKPGDDLKFKGEYNVIAPVNVERSSDDE